MANTTIARASSAADAKAIADICQDRQPTVYNRLAQSNVDATVLNAGLEKMFVDSLQDPDEILYAARDAELKAVGYINLARKTAVIPKPTELMAKARVKYEAAVMPGMNGPLLIEMWEKLDSMSEQIMSGRGDYWMIDNVGTLQSHQGQGIASALIRKALEEVCEDKPVYLDTSGDDDGRAWPLYERLGFKKVGEFEIDLTKHGGRGVHRHFGMLRESERS